MAHFAAAIWVGAHTNTTNSLDVERQRARVDEPMVRLLRIGTAIRRRDHVAARLRVRKGHASNFVGHADGDTAYLNRIKFWKTPLSDCGNGKNDCAPYSEWVQAWTSIKG